MHEHLVEEDRPLLPEWLAELGVYEAAVDRWRESMKLTNDKACRIIQHPYIRRAMQSPRGLVEIIQDDRRQRFDEHTKHLHVNRD